MNGADPTDLLRLEHAVAELVAGGVDDEEDEPSGAAVFRPVLRAVGEALGWPVALAWTVRDAPDGTALWCAASWCADGFADAGFTAANEALSFELGVGLPGTVWRTGAPTWIRDLRDYTPFPRRALAGRAGLTAAFCFPATSRDGLEGILEFFTTDIAEPAGPSGPAGPAGPSEPSGPAGPAGPAAGSGEPPGAAGVVHPVEPLVSTAVSLGRRVGDALRRRRVDETVRRSEARLRAVLNSALDCVVIADSDGTVIEFNPAACRTFGYSRAEAIGAPLAELIVPPALREQHRRGLERYLRTGSPRALDRRLEITGMRADGTEFPVELTITRVALPGRPVFTAYLRDLTERRRAEQELRSSRRRVAEAAVAERQRLERDLHDGAQQRLVWLGTTLARTRTALPDEPVRAAALLDEAIDSLEETAVELRNLARGIHPGSLTHYGLHAAIADMARRSPLELSWDESMTRRFSAAVEAAAYFVINEALTNVARHAGTDRAWIELDVVAAHLVVTVTDAGRGGAGPAGGTGLRGLADRVALLDGTLRVHSPRGGGTVVQARIPLPPD